MSQVNVTIDGKSYRMACDPGQEDHLVELAGRLDQYVAHLKTAFGEIGDQRLTVMAGIMVMDELNEAQKRIKILETDMEALRQTRDAALEKAGNADDALTGQLENLAAKLEGIAQKLV
ncbi:MAG: cell division protein ZapA [Pseudomonadota bacterium]